MAALSIDKLAMDKIGSWFNVAPEREGRPSDP
jgi:hypothetical protein